MPSYYPVSAPSCSSILYWNSLTVGRVESRLALLGVNDHTKDEVAQEDESVGADQTLPEVPAVTLVSTAVPEIGAIRLLTAGAFPP